MCNEDVSNFDQAINNQHLQECLKKLLHLYDECDELQGQYKKLSSNENYINDYNDLFVDRENMEALYLLFNLGNASALTRGLNLPKRWRQVYQMYLMFIK